MSEPVAFVLGGGGPLGAYEVGMLKALLEREIRPDMVLGSSVGALNGAMIAADPRPDAVTRLEHLWVSLRERGVFADNLFAQMGTALRSRTHLFSNAALRGLMEREFGDTQIEDLEVPFSCVAASIERAAEHWFSDGPLIEAVLASSAVPGLLPPVPVGEEHFLDGGLVDSVPVDRALASGAGTVYVLHVGRLDQPLRPPRTPREVAVVAFEIARRHRLVHALSHPVDGVEVHVLPTGAPGGRTDLRPRYGRRGLGLVQERIERAYQASADYLAERAS
ncbi:Patatin [Catenulispora acidiphila DSM 44928]|uniref:Patatin n=1 Tax=Catenulispora acidiphila (strain DSM 44928 / JCM 14897 / NBRC 102108 / NRRL B-24433 / ID139908) TaxID=479433 RepID=C7QHX2_CATAD|nr:patatin-like phospholipase family protein [Catenulispora acidiphila]ACU73017.1 Patatin [Catenulispora acidiphila DSM 44928]